MAGKNLQEILKAMAREEIKPEAKGLHNDYVSLEQLQKHMKNKYKDVEVQLRDPSNPQAHGTAQTYLRRYNILILSNMIITGDPDDTDGAVERYVEPADPDNEIILAELITELNSSETYKDLTANWSRKVRTKRVKNLPQAYKDRANAVRHKLQDGLNAAA